MFSSFMEKPLPRKPPQMGVETSRILSPEGGKQIEDTMGRSEVEVQAHRVSECPLRLDGGFPFGKDRIAEGAGLSGKPGDNPLWTGDQNLLFFKPGICRHGALLAQALGNARERSKGRSRDGIVLYFSTMAMRLRTESALAASSAVT